MPFPLLLPLIGALAPSLISGAINLFSGSRDRASQEQNRQMMQRQMTEQRQQLSPEALRQRAAIDLEAQKAGIDAGRYNQTGYTGSTTWGKDSTGRDVLKSTLSPQEQAKYNAQGRMLGDIEASVDGLHNNAKEYGDSMYGIFQRRAQPLMEASRHNFDNDLWSRGISPLNANYRQAMNSFDRSQNNSMYDAHVQAQQQGMDMATQGLNNRLSTYGALTPQSPINSFTPNVGGLVNNPYANASNYANQQQNALMNTATNMYNSENQRLAQNSANRAANWAEIGGQLARGLGGLMENGGGVGNSINRAQTQASQQPTGLAGMFGRFFRG